MSSALRNIVKMVDEKLLKAARATFYSMVGAAYGLEMSGSPDVKDNINIICDTAFDMYNAIKKMGADCDAERECLGKMERELNLEPKIK